MSTTPTKSVLPRQIDPRKFSQQGIKLTGSFGISELSRLATSVAEPNGEVVVDLTFGIDDQGNKTLSGTAKANVKVVCQRCLEALPLEINGELALAVVWDEEHAKKLPKHLEPWITGEGAADLYEIIEEELLLNLPMVAFHEQECVDKARFSSGESVEESKSVKNPFQVLEQLKGSPK